MCDGCTGSGMCGSLTVPAFQVCTVPPEFRMKIGDRKFTNVDLQRYLNHTGEQVIQLMCRDRTDLALVRKYLDDKGYMDIMAFHVKVPECFNEWSVKWQEINS